MNMHEFQPQLQDKRVIVIGFGVEGRSAAAYLSKIGAHVTVIDERSAASFESGELTTFEKTNIKMFFGDITVDPSEFDIIIRSPGVQLSHPFIAKARKHGKLVTSATEIFMGLCPGGVIGVTGTKGKGTTSALIATMLETSGVRVFLGGNIGTSPLDFLEDMTEEDWVVLELSSFQLQDLSRGPHIAVILMTTVEHQDYHETPEEYIQAKAQLLQKQQEDDIAIVNWDYLNSRMIAKNAVSSLYRVSTKLTVEDGCFVDGDRVVVCKDGTCKQVIKVDEIRLPGRHNVENACAAACAAWLAGVSMHTIASTLRSFEGLEHRLEYVTTTGGVRYYNDSFSTTPETAIAAIRAFDEPKVLILGGSYKNSDFSGLGKVITHSSSIRAIIGIGEEWHRIKAQLKAVGSDVPIVEGLETMGQIVQAAQKHARDGDVVVLSPACASFDMFANYKDRGNQFKEEVLRI